MKRRVFINEEKEPTTKRNKKSKGKKPYHSPRLTVYGNLSQLTGGGGGTRGDGASGQTRLQ
ncbi:MAG: hypothetical protein ACFFCW_38725 [Candidatus Hodarchaeota archaeon]